MEKKKLSHIVHHYCKQLDKYSRKMKDDFDEEAIHRFRVNVKKLRSFLRMMRLKAKEPDQLKYSHSFKDMYATVGQVRDRQLCLDRIKQTDKRYRGDKIADLKKEIKELAGKKDDFLSKKDFEEMEENMIDHLPAPAAIIIKDFIGQKLETARGIITKAGYSDTEMHSIRKSLKDIYYIVGIYNDDLELRLPFSFWSDEELKKAENISHALGLFNDTCIALSFLLPSEIKKKDKEERERLLAIRRQWLAEKRTLKKDVLRQIPGIRWTTGRAGQKLAATQTVG